MSDGERSAAEYDAMAAAYAQANATGAHNAYYERPATISLLGKVAGLRVLEVGCGPGLLTEWLVAQGADVTAMDVSPLMVVLARSRLGGRAVISEGDASQPLAFADGGFDLVVASLVLHYIRDWVQPFKEFRRVLVPEGAMVFSTHHPTSDAAIHSPDDYFAVKQVTETWMLDGGGGHQVTFWRRPLTAMTAAITEAGFVIEQLVEPQPSPALRDLDPGEYTRMCREPTFLFFRLRPRPTVW